MTLTYGWDATHANLASAPDGQGAGYTTGTPDIQWTAGDWAAHFGAVRICQDAGATDATADTLDVEQYAATPADVSSWADRAQESWHAGTRPGQRLPSVYCSLSVVPAVAAAMVANPPRSKPFLHVAHWGITMDQAAAMIGTVLGGMTVVGVQFANRGTYDSDVWDSSWLADQSAAIVTPPPPPPPPAPEGYLATMPEITEGATGGPVRTLQGLLAARGFHLGTTGQFHDGIDGDYGQLTSAAVRSFQEEQGITVDNIVGPVTWSRLPQS